MTSAPSRLLIVQAAGLGYDFLRGSRGPEPAGLQFAPLEPAFPAVTATAQATLRTATLPAEHGITANGFYERNLRRVFFWEQSAALVKGPRIWESFRASGRRVAMLFWQQSLGEQVDQLVSPAPIHKHHGGMIDNCASYPAGLYETLCGEVGRPFRLRDYWGPLASARASQWIADATCALLGNPAAPDLCLTYLPALDYDLQRYGTRHARSRAALEALAAQLAQLKCACEDKGYAMLVVGDYAIVDCTTPVYPNRALHESGLMAVRVVNGMQYPDLHASRAFAVVDHELAHVYVNDPAALEPVRAMLSALEGVGEVMDRTAQNARGVGHPRGAELLLTAANACWFAYPWWSGKRAAPEFAGHVDIHSKPGFDPCELFHGWPPGRVSTDPARVRGTHGRIGEGRAAAWAAMGCDVQANSLAELAQGVMRWLQA